MTGYGRGESTHSAGRLVVEMRAVNHRFCEVVVRLPRQLSPLEDRVKKAVQERVARGRCEVFITWAENGSAGRRRVAVDKELALAYYNALKELGQAIGSFSEISGETIGKMPDVLRLEEAELDIEDVWNAVREAVALALSALMEMRQKEGEALARDVLQRADNIEALAAAMAARTPMVVEEFRQRLQRRLDEMLAPGTVDTMRLATEVAILADRADISEELQRLQSHLAQLRETLRTGGGEAVGRKLDFLVQELGREVNTIGSKAGDVLIAGHVVDAKSELEKIREQVQNIE